ncbi:MAG TPA: ABC transporter permease [Xanthobacteraceae bacterium]|nr:ABC transporter permease [Xanthobacteraceae bacterium]
MSDVTNRMFRSGKRASFLFNLALPVAAACAILLAWELCVALMEVPPYILAPPSVIGERIVSDFRSGEVIPHLTTTLTEVVTGIVIAAILGLTLGTMIGIFPIIDKMLYPIILVIQTIPKVAVAPLMIIWFGYGMSSKIVTAALLAFFPVLVNVVVGIKTVDPRRITLMRMLCATPLQTYFKVRLPNMLTYLFAGLEVGVVLALIGAIVGEFVGASVGLGSLIIQRQALVDVAGVFSILAYLSVTGLLLTLAVKAIGRRVIFWNN